MFRPTEYPVMFTSGKTLTLFALPQYQPKAWVKEEGDTNHFYYDTVFRSAVSYNVAVMFNAVVLQEFEDYKIRNADEMR